MVKTVSVVKTVVVVTILALAAPACDDPADSPECKKWQSQYAGTEQFDYAEDGTPSSLGALLRQGLLEKRPDGCLIP